MDFFGILQLIGGLCLFLFGMETMGDGLKKASGSKLEEILSRLTSNVPKGVLLGTAVTAVIQSSSATTVMLVGFVNSGIMSLRQAIPVIMGANIGTTATAWLLSLSGIEGDSFLIQMLKPMSFSPILAAVAIVFMMFMKSEKKYDIGLILIGFAVLMYGMDIMSSAVKPLADVPEFISVLTMFSNPVLGVAAGAVFTAAIQSSSASVGILQALCKTGAVSYATAIPIIMGQNIGTCITAILSAIGAKKNAKRAAIVHLYFNLIGTILFMVIFYSVNEFVDFAFLADSANAAGIAVVHSAFNVAATMVLLPFAKVLEKLAVLTIPDDAEQQEEDRVLVLDSRFLETPAVAMEQCRTATIEMSEFSKKAIYDAMSLLAHYDEEKAQRVLDLEDKVDKYEDELGSYLVKLSSKNLTEKDSHSLSILLHSIGDFERISDHAINIKEAAEEMTKKDQHFSNKALVELEIFSNALKEVVDLTFDVFKTEDLTRAAQVEPLEEEIDYLQAELKRRHIKRLRKGKCTIEMGFILSDVLTSYERVADHCSNIAACLMEVNDDAFDIHEYKLDIENKEDFEMSFKKLKEKYMLP